MSDWTFDRSRIRAFRFCSARFDPATGEIALAYAFVTDAGISPELVERITVPGAPFTALQAHRPILTRLARPPSTPRCGCCI
jgi:hypothetical protein